LKVEKAEGDGGKRLRASREEKKERNDEEGEEEKEISGNVVYLTRFRFFSCRLSPSLLGVIPYAGIDLAVYETLKEVRGESA
jgi:hypothetical protein